MVLYPCARNAISRDKPTWLVINEALQDPDIVLQTEPHEGDDFVPRDGFLLGSVPEAAINLYKDIQREYDQSVLIHPHEVCSCLISVAIPTM